MTASRAAAPGVGNVANYTLLRELGSRARPTFAARRITETGKGDLVVLERCQRDGKSPSAEEAATFLRDARLVATLTHPNVGKVRAVDVVTGEVLVASDWIDGESLESLLATAPPDAKPSLEMFARLLVDVLAGLHAIHTLKDAKRAAAGLFHGELGPASLIVALDGTVKLVHVARPRPVKNPKESPSVGYLAPEVLLEDASADHRADLYSVGVLLWEAITGRKLHESRTGGQILSHQLSGRVEPPKPPIDQAWALPLADVAMRALATDPMARYNSAGQMTSDLRRAAGARIAPLNKLAAWVEKVAGARIKARRAVLEGSDDDSDDERTEVVSASKIARQIRGVATPTSAIRAKAQPAPAEADLSTTMERPPEISLSETLDRPTLTATLESKEEPTLSEVKQAPGEADERTERIQKEKLAPPKPAAQAPAAPRKPTALPVTAPRKQTLVGVPPMHDSKPVSVERLEPSVVLESAPSEAAKPVEPPPAEAPAAGPRRTEPLIVDPPPPPAPAPPASMSPIVDEAPSAPAMAPADPVTGMDLSAPPPASRKRGVTIVLAVLSVCGIVLLVAGVVRLASSGPTTTTRTPTTSATAPAPTTTAPQPETAATATPTETATPTPAPPETATAAPTATATPSTTPAAVTAPTATATAAATGTWAPAPTYKPPPPATHAPQPAFTARPAQPPPTPTAKGKKPKSYDPEGI